MTKLDKRWLAHSGIAAARWRSAAGAAVAQEKELVFGLQCDRTGADADRGRVPLPRLPRLHRAGEQQGRRRGLQDQGHRDRPRVQGAAGHGGARALQEGRRRARSASTARRRPQALTKKLEEDKIPGTSPGFGTAAAADGKRYPYHLPDRGQLLVAGRGGRRRSPRSSWAAASRARRSPISSTTTRPARSRSPILEDLAKIGGLRAQDLCRAAAGRRDGRAGARHHRQRFKPDFVIAHLFGRSPSVSIKELKGKGYPLSKVVVLRVGLARRPTSRPPAASASPRATTPCSSPASARTSRCIKDINAMYKKQGKEPPKEMDVDASLQPRRADRRAPCRGHPQRASRPRAAASPPARTSRTAWRRSRASRSAAWCRRWRSRATTTRAAAGCRSGPSRAASS